jgi:hypothetical protein
MAVAHVHLWASVFTRLHHFSPTHSLCRFQEIVDLNAVNVAMSDSKSLQRAALWKFNIEDYLSNLKKEYKLVSQQTLVGVLLFVFVQVEHLGDLECKVGVWLAACGSCTLCNGTCTGLRVRCTSQWFLCRPGSHLQHRHLRSFDTA